ncbi:MAG: sialidase family protein [Verrucomicrobia bacterium]|nr:sialidase family protein [Verrucomicrobiota bacterium]MDA1066659.1 sialidase family protein [Verrucomicrobiota bacterium]
MFFPNQHLRFVFICTLFVSIWGTISGSSPQIPFIDLASDYYRQVLVDREEGQYLGHPSTCLLDDGRTILTVYPKGHGKGGLVYKRSIDGGLTWSERLATPESWATSREVPTLHRVTDAAGKKRIILFSGLYPIRMAVTEDDGENWSELNPIGDFGGIVTMGCYFSIRNKPGHYTCLFHDDGRFIRENSKRQDPAVMTLYKTSSTDGGLTWGQPETIFSSAEIHLCEPGVIRSPDSKQLAVLLRENRRVKNSHIIFSNDEGKTWSEPRELPITLTGDRHTGKYGPDGRLFISFRGVTPTKGFKFQDSQEEAGKMPTNGDWAGWVGTWDDLVNGTPGQYVVRLMDNKKGYDTTYPGVEVLPDGTFVIVTYGHWTEHEEPYIMCVRFKLNELDAKVSHSTEVQLSSNFKTLNP